MEKIRIQKEKVDTKEGIRVNTLISDVKVRTLIGVVVVCLANTQNSSNNNHYNWNGSSYNNNNDNNSNQCVPVELVNIC